MNKKFYTFLCLIARPIFIFFYKIKVENEEKIPKKEPVIICANHTSNLDPILLAISVKRNIRYMAKYELFKNKIFKFFLKKLGTFPVNRKRGDKEAIKTSVDALKNKEILAIFIEGTRSKTGQLLRPKSGASLISLKTNTPILPVCITCTYAPGIVKIFKENRICFGNLVFPKKNSDGGFERSDLKFMNKEIMNQIANMKEKILKE